jgi:hypothetical protein
MQLTIHRQNYGITPDKEWFQKVDGQWLPIPEPEWNKRKAKVEKVVNLDELRMKPPRKNHKPKMVKLYRVIEKTAPDYEAEVLCRNGWQDYYPGTLRHNAEDSTQLSAR